MIFMKLVRTIIQMRSSMILTLNISKVYPDKNFYNGIMKNINKLVLITFNIFINNKFLNLEFKIFVNGNYFLFLLY